MSHKNRRRRRTLAATILLMLITGCSDPIQQPGATLWTPAASTDPAVARWSGKLEKDSETGALTAPGFNSLIDTAAPGWANSPDATLAELLQLESTFESPPRIYLHQQTERDETILTATITKLGDDSVRAFRYRVVLARGADKLYRFISGTWSIRSQPERGHQTFETGKCY